MTQRFAGFRLVFAVVALALWAGDAANAQVERTPTAENVVRNVKRTPSPDANPVVAPRRVSEAPVAASRGGARAARVGGTSGDSARSVDNGRNSAKQETLVSNTNCEDVSVNANDLACCLKTCREELYVCVMGDHGSCPSALSASKTPIQCFKEFKCCLETECPFPNCEPVCEPSCASDNEACGTTDDCCEDSPILECCAGVCGSDCCLGENEETCTTSSPCCTGLTCCDDGKCRINCGCLSDELCDGGTLIEPSFCCKGACFEFGKSCGEDTCYSSDTEFSTGLLGGAGNCCFITNTCGLFGDEPTPKPLFKKWGWTNGPYSQAELEAVITLSVYCGAADCNIANGFPNGQITISKLDANTIEMIWLNNGDAASPPIGGWQVHLGCGNEPYATTGNGKLSVAPGQYEFTGNDPTLITITEPRFAGCTNGLWIIIHFNNDEP